MRGKKLTFNLNHVAKGEEAATHHRLDYCDRNVRFVDTSFT